MEQGLELTEVQHKLLYGGGVAEIELVKVSIVTLQVKPQIGKKHLPYRTR